MDLLFQHMDLSLHGLCRNLLPASAGRSSHCPSFSSRAVSLSTSSSASRLLLLRLCLPRSPLLRHALVLPAIPRSSPPVTGKALLCRPGFIIHAKTALDIQRLQALLRALNNCALASAWTVPSRGPTCLLQLRKNIRRHAPGSGCSSSSFFCAAIFFRRFKFYDSGRLIKQLPALFRLSA